MARGISLSVEFSPLLEKIQRAGGNIEQATMQAAQKSAGEMDAQLHAECNAAGVPSSVSDEIKSEVKRDASGNRYACTVGWKMGNYDPKNPSAGYKAVFANYGTPRRSVKADKARVNIGGEFRTLGTDRGEITGRGFITMAKKKARPKIKKAQEEVLRGVLEELK